MTTPSDGRPPLRIGTDEREAAYAALGAHLNAGRLDPDEYGERYAQASVARTRSELDVLFLDLPEPHPFPEPQQRLTWAPDRRDWQRLIPASTVLRVLAALAVIAALAVVVPLAAGGALVWFVVLPILTGRSCRGRRPYRSYRGWYGPTPHW